MCGKQTNKFDNQFFLFLHEGQENKTRQKKTYFADKEIPLSSQTNNIEVYRAALGCNVHQSHRPCRNKQMLIINSRKATIQL